MLEHLNLAPWQWGMLVLAATCAGLGKTGLPGMNVLTVSLFATILTPRLSTGMLLPLLICADCTAVTTLRKHAEWPELKRLFPWAALGVAFGWAAMNFIQDDKNFSRLMGLVLLSLVLIQFWRKRHPAEEDVPQGFWWPIIMGCMAGFTTMVSNSAGPLIVLYLLGRRLPKMALVGTMAWFFLCMNLFKLPFSVQMGLISLDSLPLDLILAPFAVAGAIFGRLLLPYIKQSVFEVIALSFTSIAALKLLFF